MSKQAPVNTKTETEENPLRFLATSLAKGSTGNAIIAMERAGQSSFVNSDTLPVDMSDETRQALEAAGVIFGDRVPGDDLFVYVTLPEGWTRRGTTHDMHSDLLDEKGRKRASVFYKAAFYDRRAHMRLTSPQDYLCGCLDDGTMPVLDDAWLTADVVAQELATMPDYYRDAAEALRLRLVDTPERPA